MEIALKYGERTLAADLPFRNATLLRSRSAPPVGDWRDLLQRRLEHPEGTPALREILKPGERVLIAVSDITRIWNRTRDYLPMLLGYIEAAGIRELDIAIIIARGCHRSLSEAEKKQVVGEEVFTRFPVLEHDPDDDANLIYVGTTSRKNDIYVNRNAVEYDKLILTGGIVHHAMAGFGGGRKSILPGLSGRKTVRSNHLNTLDPRGVGINPAIGSNKTTGNPIHEDMMEAAALVNPDFLVNVVIDQRGEIVDFFTGHWAKAWQKGCQLVNELYSVPVEQKADLVIASCGGYPQDISLYQASKTYYNAGRAAKESGVIIIAAEARDGAGSDDFFRWFQCKDEAEYCRRLRENFSIPGYLAYLIYIISQTHRVYLLTDVPEKEVRQIGAVPVHSLGEAITRVRDEVGDAALVVVMPEGGFTLPILRDGID